MPKTFLDIIKLTQNMIDEVDSSEQVLSIIKNAINTAYISELAEYDKRISTAYVPIINGVGNLPDDLDSIENISPSLIDGERRVGNVILSSRNTTFTVTYSVLREELVNDTDEVDLSLKFIDLLVIYACYLYFQYRRKTSIANNFLNEYQRKIAKLIDKDSMGEESIQDVYGGN